MANVASSIGSSAKRKAGRPRRLTLDAIVTAACELGLGHLEMHAVAERLNTGVATLYGYVRGREHLEELVLQRLATPEKMFSTAQTWQELLREYASASFRVTESSPHVLANLATGTPGQVENTYAAALIARLSSCGLSKEEATGLYIEVIQVVIGAAICSGRARRLNERDPSSSESRSFGAVGDYRPTVDRIIRDFERSRSDARAAPEGE